MEVSNKCEKRDTWNTRNRSDYTGRLSSAAVWLIPVWPTTITSNSTGSTGGKVWILALRWKTIQRRCHSCHWVGGFHWYFTNRRQFKFDPLSHHDGVTCHLCVLNAHRSHQRNCPYSTPEHPRCECRPTLLYDLYDRHDIDGFLWHLKSRHLEYYERFRDLLTKVSVQRRLAYERNRDVWEAQKMIRDVFGMGDDLI